MTGRDDDIVHQAEAHSARRQSVMAWGPHRGERMPAAREGMTHGGQHGTRGPKDGGPAVAIEDGIEKERPSAPCAHRLE
jgi:hypothetical protein